MPRSNETALSRRDALRLLAGAAGAMGVVGTAGAVALAQEADEQTSDAAPEAAATEDGAASAAAPDGVIEAGGFTMLPYAHFASGGVAQDLYAVILFENSNSTFTKYQVAYTSCTCRDAAMNYRSVMYVEILNTAETADGAKLRWVTFGDDEGYHAGLWADSNPIHGRPDYTDAYMDEQFVSKLVGLTKADFDAWEGYGSQVTGIDVDAVAGATVSTGNITSVLKALLAYHAAKYYQ